MHGVPLPSNGDESHIKDWYVVDSNASAPSDELRVSPSSDLDSAASTSSISRRMTRVSERRQFRKALAAERRSERKNPAIVLLTMAAVGGMFAVVGLPAYAAMTDPGSSATYLGTDADAQSVNVDADLAVAGSSRDGFTATTPEELAAAREAEERASAVAVYLASGAREAGDDYPWPYGGSGLSPLNYYYGECVDFVAWRLNRDAGVTGEPFKWVWSTLTPTGGSAGQWQYAWQAHGWPVSSDPVVGAVAVTGYDHVAYVKEVLGDGNVLIEEYNYAGYHQYGQRIIAAASVIAFLYPPG